MRTNILLLTLLLSLPGLSSATLMSRLGGAAAYDDMLDILWTTEADLSGGGTWQDQLDWIASLNTNNYLGYNDWRLASMSVSAGLPTGTAASVVICNTATEEQCKDNELGYMYYYNLTPAGDPDGKTDFLTDLRGDHTVGDVTLTGVQSIYWSGTEFDSFSAWNLDFGRGGRGNGSKVGNSLYGWAVRSGDVTAAPEPGTAVLLGLGLLGLGVGRRQRRAT